MVNLCQPGIPSWGGNAPSRPDALYGLLRFVSCCDKKIDPEKGLSISGLYLLFFISATFKADHSPDSTVLSCYCYVVPGHDVPDWSSVLVQIKQAKEILFRGLDTSFLVTGSQLVSTILGWLLFRLVACRKLTTQGQIRRIFQTCLNCAFTIFHILIHEYRRANLARTQTRNLITIKIG